MVRYRGENEYVDLDDTDEVPGTYHGPPIVAPLVWMFLALAVLVVLTLLVGRHN